MLVKTWKSELPWSQVKTSLPWAHVGPVIQEAFEDLTLTEDDCQCFAGEEAVAFRRGVRRIHWDVLSQFEVGLSELKGVLDSQVAQSEQTKAKILAGMVTMTLAGLQVMCQRYIIPETVMVLNGTAF